MTKIVINQCFGGFSLSEAGIYAYASHKGLTLYPEKCKYSFTVWWTVPADQRTPHLEGAAWHEASLEERRASNEAYRAQSLDDRDIPRDDPALILVVEADPKLASGRVADLKVVEIPDDIDWEIQGYDGREWVAEKHRTWG